MPWGLKNKTINQAHHHHHQGQNRPHQKTITHPQGPPRACRTICTFFHGSEGLIGSPLPHLNSKNVPVIELLLYDRRYQNKSTEKDKQI